MLAPERMEARIFARADEWRERPAGAADDEIALEGLGVTLCHGGIYEDLGAFALPVDPLGLILNFYRLYATL